jgi:hypothetical protein
LLEQTDKSVFLLVQRFFAEGILRMSLGQHAWVCLPAQVLLIDPADVAVFLR